MSSPAASGQGNSIPQGVVVPEETGLRCGTFPLRMPKKCGGTDVRGVRLGGEVAARSPHVATAFGPVAPGRWRGPRAFPFCLRLDGQRVREAPRRARTGSRLLPVARRDGFLGVAKPGGTSEAPPRSIGWNHISDEMPANGGQLLGVLLLSLLHALDHLPHQIPGFPLHPDRLGLTRVLKLQHILDFAYVRQRPPHELHRARLLLLPALLLLSAIRHWVSSHSDLRPRFANLCAFRPATFSTRGVPKLDPGGPKVSPRVDVYVPDYGGTKTQRR